VRRGGSSRDHPSQEWRGRLASDYERIRSWRGSGRAIIAPAPKLPGTICHTLNPRGPRGLLEFLFSGKYNVKEFPSSL
jgi:hypothetical protein